MYESADICQYLVDTYGDGSGVVRPTVVVLDFMIDSSLMYDATPHNID